MQSFGVPHPSAWVIFNIILYVLVLAPRSGCTASLSQGWDVKQPELCMPRVPAVPQCVQQERVMVEEQRFKGLRNSNKPPAAFYGKRRIVLSRKMLYINVVLAIEITSKWYFDKSLRHQRCSFWVTIETWEKNFLTEVLDFGEEFFPFFLWCCWSEEML